MFKIKVKALLVAVVVMLFIQIPTAFGAEGGYFNKRQTNVGLAVTDDDVSTYVDLRYSHPTFTFEKPEDVVKIYADYQDGLVSSNEACFYFYDDNKKLIKEIKTAIRGGWVDADVKGVQSIKVQKCDSYGYSVYISEIDFVVQSQLVYEPISKAEWTVTHNQINLSWTNPKGAIATHIMLDGRKIDETTADNYVIKNLSSDTKYKVDLVAVYKFGVAPAYKNEIKTSAIPILLDKDFEVSEITDKSAEVLFKSKGLKSPPDYIAFYDEKDSFLGQTTVRTDGNTYYKISWLKPETDYVYYARAKFGSTFTEKVKLNFTTLEGDKEVSNLRATATAQEVELMWTMPEYKNLKIARIYRQKDDVGLLARLFTSTHELIFETNGTTFKDLNLKQDTEYKYKITTVDKDGNETDGKAITIKTKKISAGGGGTNKDENGDYVITWTTPVTGKMKVMIGGKEYSIVPASDKKIVIPKDQMKFDLIGNPDVQLIPIDDDGKEGTPSKPGAGEGTGNGGGIGDVVGGGEVGKVINPENTLIGGTELLKVVGGFILLGLAFLVVPRLIKLIRNSLETKTTSKRRVQG